MTSRGVRATRGAAIAVFATFVASLAHTVGGGAAPGPVALLLALAFSAPLAMLLTGARARLFSTSISALVAQAALHLCYALGSAPAAIATSAGVNAAHTGHTGHGAAAHVDALLAAPVADHGDAVMPFAHVVAAAITIVALALGDDVFDAVGRTVLLFVRRLTSAPVPVVVAPVHVAASAARPRLVGALLHAALGSRGPPVALAAS